MSQEERSEALIEVLEELDQSDIGFVLVGGMISAVSLQMQDRRVDVPD